MIGVKRTDADSERDEAESGQGILDEVGTTGAQESSTSAVVFAVVGGVEAGILGLVWAHLYWGLLKRGVHCVRGGKDVHSGGHLLRSSCEYQGERDVSIIWEN